MSETQETATEPQSPTENTSPLIPVPDAKEAAELLDNHEAVSFAFSWCVKHVLSEPMNIMLLNKMLRAARKLGGIPFADTVGRAVIAAYPQLQGRVTETLRIVCVPIPDEDL